MEAWFTIFSYHVNRPIETTQGNSVNEFLVFYFCQTIFVKKEENKQTNNNNNQLLEETSNS